VSNLGHAFLIPERGRSGLRRIAHDTFTGADGTLLSAHAADDGGSWSSHPDGSYEPNSILLDINEAVRVNTGVVGINESIYLHSVTPSSADYEVRFDLIVHQDNNNQEAGVVLRSSPSAASFYLVRYGNNADRWRISRSTNGSGVTLGTFIEDTPLTGLHRAAVRISGTAITLFRDGAAILNVTDTAFASAGRVGLYLTGPGGAAGGGGMNIDNFSVWMR
jgi:hypothetical protein